MKIARIATIPFTFIPLKAQYKYFTEQGAEVHFIASEDPYWIVLEKELGLIPVKINIPREIDIKNDLLALWKLYRHFRKERYDIVHSNTPKAGLVVALAAFAARVPVRLHTFTGQRWATFRGVKRSLFKSIDYLISTLNTHCYADSKSQVEFLEAESAVRKKRVTVIHHGSFGGVDLNVFNPDLYPNAKAELRTELNISIDSKCILFVGRIHIDKGIRELVEAFEQISKINSNIHLVIVGEFDGSFPLILKQKMISHPNIHLVGFKDNPAFYYAGADLFCLPSYREGFGTVVIEAGAMKLPTIGTNIPGLKDAIVNGKTGILVSTMNSQEIEKTLLMLLEENSSSALGLFSCNASAYVKTMFSDRIVAEKVWEAYKEFSRLEKL